MIGGRSGCCREVGIEVGRAWRFSKFRDGIDKMRVVCARAILAGSRSEQLRAPPAFAR